MVFRSTCFDFLSLPTQILNNDEKTKSIYYTAQADFPDTQPAGLRVFTYLELTYITRDFDHLSKIGEGEFGSIYEGPFLLLDRGTKHVFIKKLKGTYVKGHKQWEEEVKVLGSIDHPNLVKLVGYCVNGDEESTMQRFLVYDGGISLGVRIIGNSHPFYGKYEMLKVALDVARGLACLHEAMENQVAFGDFNYSNVHFCHHTAKLSKFGLHQDGLAHVSTEDIGNMEYIAPEYIDGGNLTSKSDVWSYGVFLFEIISGKRLLDTNRPTNEQNLIDWVTSCIDSEKFEEITDPRIYGMYSVKSVQSLCLIARMCLTKEPKSRPEMRHVVAIVNLLTSDQSETASPPPLKGGTFKGQGRVPAPPKVAATSVKIIGFRGNLVDDTNKSPICPYQNKFGPPNINVQVPPPEPPPLQSLVPKDVQHTNSSCLPRVCHRKFLKSCFRKKNCCS